MNTLLLTIATVISSVFGVHAPVQQLVSTPDYVTKTELQSAMNAYVARIQSPKLGAAPSPAALATYTLAGSGVSSSATSITLTSLTIKQTSQKIVTSDLRQGATDSFYITIEPGNTTRQEIVGCTGVTQNSNGTATLTGCSRGMSPIYPYTASSTLRFTHAGSSQVIFGDAPQIFNDFNNYVASAIVSGAVDSSATVKGIVENATGAEAAAHAQIGSGNTSAPLVLTTGIASSTRTANTAQVIVASSTDGYLDETYLNPALKKAYTFSATSTMATTTINGATPVGMILATSTTVSGTVMTLTGIPATADNLKVVINATSTTGANTNFNVTFNSDTSSSYSFSSFTTPGTLAANLTPFPTQSASQHQMYLVFNIANAANSMKLFDLLGTDNYGGSVFGTTTTGYWKNAAQINSITITSTQAGSMGVGSYIRVYANTQ